MYRHIGVRRSGVRAVPGRVQRHKRAHAPHAFRRDDHQHQRAR